jgi:hypothetical protein
VRAGGISPNEFFAAESGMSRTRDMQHHRLGLELRRDHRGAGGVLAHGAKIPAGIATLDRPFKQSSGIWVLRGNISAPDGVITKPSAASPQLLRHREQARGIRVNRGFQGARSRFSSGSGSRRASWPILPRSLQPTTAS